MFIGFSLCSWHWGRHSCATVCPQDKHWGQDWGELVAAGCLLFVSYPAPSLIWSSLLMLPVPSFLCVPFLLRPMSPCCLPFLHSVSSTWYMRLVCVKLLLLLQSWVQASFFQWARCLSPSWLSSTIFFMLSYLHKCLCPCQLGGYMRPEAMPSTFLSLHRACHITYLPTNEMKELWACNDSQSLPLDRPPLSQDWRIDTDSSHTVTRLLTSVPIVCFHPMCGSQSLNGLAYLFS